MAASKKVLTKGQIVTHFAEKFEVSKKVAASMIDEVAALAIAETKKKGAFVLPGIGNWERNQDSGKDRREDQTSQSI